MKLKPNLSKSPQSRHSSSAEAGREGELRSELPEAPARSALKPRPAEARRGSEMEPNMGEIRAGKEGTTTQFRRSVSTEQI